MELALNLIDFIIHIDLYLNQIIQEYGLWTYLILFLIIFLETGFVATPFLPGDSLLFAAGAFAAMGSLEALWLIGLLALAAILGDTTNYWIGRHAGNKISNPKYTRYINKEYLEKTQHFYEKHGGKTIIIARFLPIIRTFAPFVAGIGKMSYWKFLSYNITGGIAWVLIFVSGGYYFGNIPIVRENFTIVILAIIVISLIPAAIEVTNHYRRRKKAIGN